MIDVLSGISLGLGRSATHAEWPGAIPQRLVPLIPSIRQLLRFFSSAVQRARAGLTTGAHVLNGDPPPGMQTRIAGLVTSASRVGKKGDSQATFGRKDWSTWRLGLAPAYGSESCPKGQGEGSMTPRTSPAPELYMQTKIPSIASTCECGGHIVYSESTATSGQVRHRWECQSCGRYELFFERAPVTLRDLFTEE